MHVILECVTLPQSAPKFRTRHEPKGEVAPCVGVTDMGLLNLFKIAQIHLFSFLLFTTFIGTVSQEKFDLFEKHYK